LVVIAGRYKNPTSFWSKQQEDDEWWDPLVEQYLLAARIQLGPNLAIFGDIRIQPTAVRPLSGFTVFAGASSAIFGHPKLQLQTVPTATWMPRIFATTGACTVANYTSSKAGKKGAAHHVLGAAVIEQEGELFHLRQLNYHLKQRSFIDISTQYRTDGVAHVERADVYTAGDIHRDTCDEDMLEATFHAADSPVQTTQPRYVVYHDTLDFERRNHHTIQDPWDRWARTQGDPDQTERVEPEIRAVVEFIDATPDFAEPKVIVSNHDQAFDRWLRDSDPKADLVNAEFFHEMWLAKLRDWKQHQRWRPALQLYYERHGKGRAEFLGAADHDTLRINDVEHVFHGHDGINGARATATTYAQLGCKVTHGHRHSPYILDGAYGTGIKARVQQGYNSRPCSWLTTDCLQYVNGKRTLINFVRDEQGRIRWRLDDRTR
jgi:hypothetical protein